MAVGILLAILAAAAFAVASVAQHRAAARTKTHDALDPALMVALAKDRLWLAGTGGDVAGLGLQAVAMGFAPVIVVQPLLTASLLIAVPLNAVVDHRRPSRPEMIGAVLCTVGLIAFLAVSHPREAPNEDVSFARALPMLIGAALVTAFVVLDSRRRQPGPGRAMILAVGAGTLFGVCGPLLRLVATHVDTPGELVTSWPLYALIVIGLASYLLLQNAFQSGELPAPLAVFTIIEPTVGAFLGLAILGEAMSTQPLNVVGEVAAAIAVAVGIVLLARRNEYATGSDSATPSADDLVPGGETVPAGTARAPDLPGEGRHPAG
ncbi:MAG: DMT family transporter [Frankiaceae bacterium]